MGSLTWECIIMVMPTRNGTFLSHILQKQQQKSHLKYPTLSKIKSFLVLGLYVRFWQRWLFSTSNWGYISPPPTPHPNPLFQYILPGGCDMMGKMGLLSNPTEDGGYGGGLTVASFLLEMTTRERGDSTSSSADQKNLSSKKYLPPPPPKTHI